jgi:hypothetical protein
MAKWFFHASFTPKIDGKVDIAQKRHIVGLPDHLFQLLSEFFKTRFLFLLFLNCVPSFFGVNSRHKKRRRITGFYCTSKRTIWAKDPYTPHRHKAAANYSS